MSSPQEMHPEDSTPCDNPIQFEQLVAPYLDGMFQVAHRILKSPDLAWDAVQDTLFRAWKGSNLPDEPRAALLHRVYLSSLHIRRCEKRRDGHEAHACLLHPRDLGPGLELSDSEAEELHDELETLISKLPEDCQAVLWLRVCQNRSYAEISDELRIPVGTVRSRLNRARSLLRVCLDTVESRRKEGSRPEASEERGV